MEFLEKSLRSRGHKTFQDMLLQGNNSMSRCVLFLTHRALALCGLVLKSLLQPRALLFPSALIRLQHCTRGFKSG